VDIQLGVTVATALEAERLEVVVAYRDLLVSHEDMAPDVASLVRHAVDAHVAAAAVVGVEAEVVYAVARRRERDHCVKTYVPVDDVASTLTAEAFGFVSLDLAALNGAGGSSHSGL